MDMLISLIVVIFSQCIHISKYHVVHLKMYNFYLSKIKKIKNNVESTKYGDLLYLAG